jgi:hypothetical protein
MIKNYPDCQSECGSQVNSNGNFLAVPPSRRISMEIKRDKKLIKQIKKLEKKLNLSFVQT